MAFEEIKAKLGLDISNFEKGMLNANRLAAQTAAAQNKLADFRRNKALSEASDTGKIILLQKELADLYALQTQATAGTAPYLKAQLEIEKKLVEIGEVRRRQKEAEKAAAADNISRNAEPARAAKGATPATATGGGFVDFRKSVLDKANAIGAGGLLKGFGVAALVTELLRAGQAAQTVRDRARETGEAVEHTTAQAARLADAFGSVRSVISGAGGLFQTIMAIPVDAFDGLIAGASALAGIGNVSDNLRALREDPAIEAARASKAIEELSKKKEAAAKVEAAFQSALADLEQARVDVLEEQLSIEDKILFKKEQIKMAEDDASKTAADSVESLKAEQEIVKRNAELRQLIQQRDEQAADKKQTALDLQKKTEEDILAQKEKQIAKEEQLAAIREASAKKLQAAQEAAAKAGQAYAQALSDQSAASLADVTAGTRGSRADQRAALRVQDLRTQAQTARDTGRASLIGGEFVSQADILSQQANQIQSGIGSLSSTERDPLASVTEQLVKANEELASIRESLTIMEVEN